MKMTAISTHETSTIIRHLAAHGTWRAERLGVPVEMARIKAAEGHAIQYAVTLRPYVVEHARVPTVKDAVDAINAIIAGRRREDPPAGRVADPTRTGTPHLVRKARHASAEERSGRLFG